ncbi:MAG: cytochrome c family protein [Desulfobacteraceae bacterium]|nr:cytochrome c family protein [Desulfobacteraceae bacterium]
MKKRAIILGAIISGVVMLMAAGLYAGTEGCPDTVEMKNENAFEQHKMPVVNFDHAKHSEEYGITCGECHHDENHEPLADLTCQGKVQPCFECHSGTGAGTPKDFMGPKPDVEALKSYYTAVHVNCVGCHKKQDGPKSCTECHAK